MSEALAPIKFFQNPLLLYRDYFILNHSLLEQERFLCQALHLAACLVGRFIVGIRPKVDGGLGLL